jgi:hypothetical protein
MTQQPAATAARDLLRTAARSLHTADPTGEGPVSTLLEETFGPGPGRRDALTPIFSERRPGSLSFSLAPGRAVRDSAGLSTAAAEEMIGSRFGPEALRWFDRLARRELASNSGSVQYGASFGTSFDGNGPVEAMVAYRWGPGTVEALPAKLFELARAALDALPGLRPAVSTIRCGRTTGSQQISFDVEGPLALADLRPLMDRLGLGHQHPGLMSACAFVLGARFTLPPDSAMVTLRPTRVGVELRLDVVLDAIPDLPPELVGLLQLQLAERPRSQRALDRWLAAMTPDGLDTPGDVSVLSILTRPDLPARIALYLRPAALAADSPAATPEPAVLVSPEPVAAA